MHQCSRVHSWERGRSDRLRPTPATPQAPASGPASGPAIARCSRWRLARQGVIPLRAASAAFADFGQLSADKLYVGLGEDEGRSHRTIRNRIGVGMVNLNDAVGLLRAKRQELLAQLDAVDKALAALSRLGVAVTATSEGNPQQATEEAAIGVLPIRLKPPRALSDEHKHALNEGRRKARHSKDAAAGFAREIPDPSHGLAPVSGPDGRRPRLVKRTRGSEGHR